MADRFIAPNGAGDGSSWANAASIKALSQMISQAGPGGKVLIRADAGDVYQFNGSADTLTLSAGGAVGNPVKVYGSRSDGTPAKALFSSTRTQWQKPTDSEQTTDVSAWNHGSDLIYLQSGASHITFSGLAFTRCQFGFIFKSPVVGITIEDCDAYNVRAFQDVSAGIAARNIILRRINVVGFSKKAFRMRGDSSDWLFLDIVADSARQDRDNFAMGIEFNETAHQATVRNCEFMNCHDTLNAYHNGDGISAELGNYELLLEDVKSHGHTDGGFDLKAQNTVLRRTHCYDNKVNYRCWGKQRYESVKSGPTKYRGGAGNRAHIGLYGTTGTVADLTVAGIELQDSGEAGGYIFWAWNDNAKAVISGAKITNPSNLPLTKINGAGASITVDQSSTPPVSPPPPPVQTVEAVAWKAGFEKGIPSTVPAGTIVASVGARNLVLEENAIVTPPVSPPVVVPPPVTPTPVPNVKWALTPSSGDGVTFELKDKGVDSYGSWQDVRVYGSPAVQKTMVVTFGTLAANPTEYWKSEIGQRLVGGGLGAATLSYVLSDGVTRKIVPVTPVGTSAPLILQSALTASKLGYVWHSLEFSLPAGRSSELVLRIYNPKLVKA